MIALSLAMISSCKKDDKDDNNNNNTSGYPTSGLVSYFNFDDNIKDQVGTTPDGTNYGATFVAGKNGEAIDFNGSGQYVEYNRASFVSGNNVSVSCWINYSLENNNSIYFIMCNDFGIFTTDGIGMAISVPGTNNAKGASTPDTWYHFVGTYDGTYIKAYINGVLVQTTEHPGELQELNYNLQLGTFQALDGYWHGSIDDLFIYEKVLSQAEITQLYNYHQ